MEKKFIEFIGIFDGAVDGKSCENLIQYFESQSDRHKRGKSGGLVQPNVKDSTDLHFYFDELIGEETEEKKYLHPFLSSLEKGIAEYKEKFSLSLDDLSLWAIQNDFQVQRYLPGEGYFAWHSEASRKSVSDRKLVWMIYLNDVDNAGTQFYNQGICTDCKCGRLVIWPADWTHLHRGETDQKEAKYILTGWFRLI
jgi:prolyl 4-hydroxylase